MGIIIDFLGYIFPFLAVLTVLVFVHELGHYLVARLNNVRVEIFSIGFGPELFGWEDSNKTRWRLSVIPFGGYVKFFGDDNIYSGADQQTLVASGREENGQAFHSKTLTQRAAIVFAGPFANFLYAVIVLTILYSAYGQRFTPPEIGRVIANAAGDKAGFKVGDVVQKIDGEEIDQFEDLQQVVMLNPGRELVIEVRRGEFEKTIIAIPTAVARSDIEGFMREYGDLGIFSANPAIVGKVYPNSPAEIGGLKLGDQVIEANGVVVESFETLQEIVLASGGGILSIKVLRNGREMSLAITPTNNLMSNEPEIDSKRWLIGVQREARPPIALGMTEALWAAVDTSYDMIKNTIKYLGEMISGSRGTEDLGGPLRIAHASGQAAQVGFEQLILLSVLLSLNLGLVNLFPIPILDGGHLLLYGLEALRGRPLSERSQDYIFRFGLSFVLVLTIFATWNDLVNLRIVDFITGLF